MNVQLDLFETNDETSLLRQEIKQVKERLENARKGLFARHSDLHRMCIEQNKEIEHLRELIYGILSPPLGKEEPLFAIERVG